MLFAADSTFLRQMPFVWSTHCRGSQESVSPSEDHLGCMFCSQKSGMSRKRHPNRQARRKQSALDHRPQDGVSPPSSGTCISGGRNPGPRVLAEDPGPGSQLSQMWPSGFHPQIIARGPKASIKPRAGAAAAGGPDRRSKGDITGATESEAVRVPSPLGREPARLPFVSHWT